jgi:hypothetical protein
MGRLFQTRRQREREERRDRLKATREAEESLQLLRARVSDIRKEAEGHWAEALRAQSSGQVELAKHRLASYRAAQGLLQRMETKALWVEQAVRNLQSAATDAEVAGVMERLSTSTLRLPERVDRALRAAKQVMKGSKSADQAWAAIGEDPDLAGAASDPALPSLADLESRLLRESLSVGADDVGRRIQQGLEQARAASAKARDAEPGAADPR